MEALAGDLITVSKPLDFESIDKGTPIDGLSVSALTYQTMLSALPSVVVTIGEPLPRLPAHHATEILGGDEAVISSAVICPEPEGQPTPSPRNATNVRCDVVYATAALMIASDDTCLDASQ